MTVYYTGWLSTPLHSLLSAAQTQAQLGLAYTSTLIATQAQGGVVVRKSDSPSREPRFESFCCNFEANSLLAIIAAWLNASRRSWDGFGTNRPGGEVL